MKTGDCPLLRLPVLPAPGTCRVCSEKGPGLCCRWSDPGDLVQAVYPTRTQHGGLSLTYSPQVPILKGHSQETGRQDHVGQWMGIFSGAESGGIKEKRTQKIGPGCRIPCGARTSLFLTLTRVLSAPCSSTLLSLHRGVYLSSQ